jgi:hypothetical protein
MHDPSMIRRKLLGALQHLWPQLLQWLQTQGWDTWVERVLGILPMVGRLLGLPLSLPPHPWQESLPQAAAEYLQALPDDQLVSLVSTAQTWINWLADPGGGADGSDSAK